MAIVFLSLMVILSSVEGYRQPFTAFRQHQVDRVHGSGFVSSRIAEPVAPVVHKIVSHPRYTSYTPRKYTPAHKASFTSRFQPVNNFVSNRGFRITNSFDPFRQGFTRGNIPNNRFTSGSIVDVAKAQAEEALTILKAIEGSEIAAQFIEPVFETSDCLTSVEDVIKLIEDATELLVDNGPEIVYLEAIVDSLKDEKDIVKLTKGSSKMLRTLADLGPALAAGASNVCISSPETSVSGFKDLANALRDIGDNRNLNVPPRSRQLLETSADIMDTTAEFLDAQLNAINKFNAECKSDNTNQVAIYNLMTDIMGSLAKMFEALGFDDKVEEINKQSELIKKFVDSFAGLEDLGLELDCGLVGDYKALAQVQDDLVQIIEEVGIETLSEQLGISFEL